MNLRNKTILNIAALFWVAIFFSCKNDLKEVHRIQIEDDVPVEVAHGVSLYYSDSARVKLKLEAETVERFLGEEAKTVFSEGIHIQFLNGVGQVETDIRANHAIKYEKDLLTEATGNVVVINEKGEQLNTEKLLWDEKKEMIRTDEFVKVTTATQVIMGEGLEADQQFTWYEIKNIKGTISLDDE